MLSYVDCEKLVMMCTANEGMVRIQYKWLVPIYVFPPMKLCSPLISKTELRYNVLSPNSYTHISEIYIFF